MKRILLVLLLPILSFAFSTSASAQFEGKIFFEMQNYSENGSAEQTNFSMTASGDRLFISSNRQVETVAGLKTSGLLVRNDLNDFIFHTAPGEALKISKDDIDGLIQLIQRFNRSLPQSEQKAAFDWEKSVIETGNTRSILGYQTAEFQLNLEDADETVSVWVTQDIKVNWGLLMQFWYETGQKIGGDNVPVELVMNRNSFPLLIEVVDNGKTTMSLEARSIDLSGFDRGVLDLSDQTKLLGMSELMINLFRQQR